MTDKPDEQHKPKIIIDEDWKAQIDAEKEALRQKEAAEQAERGGQGEQPGAPGAGEQAGPMPPASLTFLATTLATQAMVAMGLLPNPLTGKAEVRLDQARHLVDTLQVLQEKTEGNRTREESQVLDGLLHELRMGFISVQDRKESEPEGGADEEK